MIVLKYVYTFFRAPASKGWSLMLLLLRVSKTQGITSKEQDMAEVAICDKVIKGFVAFTSLPLLDLLCGKPAVKALEQPYGEATG